VFTDLTNDDIKQLQLSVGGSVTVRTLLAKIKV
jgi:hypothetical protein